MDANRRLPNEFIQIDGGGWKRAQELPVSGHQRHLQVLCNGHELTVVRRTSGLSRKRYTKRLVSTTIMAGRRS